MSNQTKHTPGPWHLNTLEVVTTTIHANRGHVATVSAGTMNEVSADEQEANARLIVAAPDMLRALEDAVKRMEIIHEDQLHPSERNAFTNALIGVRNAIAKATAAA